jgi:hypothetical protein
VYIGLFKRKYTLRHYEPQTITDGYASASYTDATVRLDVQPLSPDELMAIPEGERTVKRIKSFGPEPLTSADEYKHIPGDRLFYQGYWYECKSSVMWDHTLLSHYRSEFVIYPCTEQEEPPPAPTVPEPPGGGGP